jgi:hypothetical protein
MFRTSAVWRCSSYVKQLPEFVSFTDGAFLCVRPEETHDVHAIECQPSSSPVLTTLDNIRPADSRPREATVRALRAASDATPRHTLIIGSDTTA